MGGNELVNPVRFAAGVVPGAIHLVAAPRDGLTVHIVQWRGADHLAADRSSRRLR